MIALLNSIPAGNAVGILLSPPSTAVKWRVLRNLSGTFVDENDDLAVYEGDDRHFIDSAGLENGIPVYYKPFYFNGTAWSSGAVKTITPGVSFVDRSVDPQSLVRDRMDIGLNAMIAAGRFVHPHGIFPVLLQSPQYEGTNFPIVSVHYSNSSDDARGVGELLIGEFIGDDGGHEAVDGWLDRVKIDVVVWSLNGDERRVLRQLVKSILIANLGIFNDQGMQQITVEFSDHDDFNSYPCPVFSANGVLSCLVPASISGDSDITVTEIITTVDSFL